MKKLLTPCRTWKLSPQGCRSWSGSTPTLQSNKTVERIMKQHWCRQQCWSATYGELIQACDFSALIFCFVPFSTEIIQRFCFLWAEKCWFAGSVATLLRVRSYFETTLQSIDHGFSGRGSFRWTAEKHRRGWKTVHAAQSEEAEGETQRNQCLQLMQRMEQRGSRTRKLQWKRKWPPPLNPEQTSRRRWTSGAWHLTHQTRAEFRGLHVRQTRLNQSRNRLKSNQKSLHPQRKRFNFTSQLICKTNSMLFRRWVWL